VNYLLLSTNSFFGFSILEILLHMLNLVILLVGFTFLLYKPIKKIIDTRKEEFAKAEEQKTEMLRETEEFRAGYDAMIINAKDEERRIVEGAQEKAKEEGNIIIENAKDEARAIYEKAVRDTQAQKAKMKEELAETVPDLAVKVASEILRREINPDDHNAIIQTIVDEWKD